MGLKEILIRGLADAVHVGDPDANLRREIKEIREQVGVNFPEQKQGTIETEHFTAVYDKSGAVTKLVKKE